MDHTVSLIITARNCRQYLPETLESALHQSVMPCEVIYSDDGSGDGSVQYVATEWPQVRVIARDWRGVAEARNEAAFQARGAWLLHLDGDDILPERYIEHRLAAATANPDAAFIYGPAQGFGTQNHWYDVPDQWDAARLWCRNWINTSTLVKRDAFRAVGGWRPGAGTCWDWDLFLRLAQAGYQGAADRNGFLLYRRRRDSHSHRIRPASEAREFELRVFHLVRALAARQEICAVVGDRLPGLLPAWLERLAQCADAYSRHLQNLEPPHESAEIVPPRPALSILYTGAQPARVAEKLAYWSTREPFSAVNFRHWPWRNPGTTKRDTANNTATFLADAYNWLLETTPAELVWFVEDDVLPPIDALVSLNTALIGDGQPRAAAAGAYRNRHVPERLIAHQVDAAGRTQPLLSLPAGPTSVNLVGTGCLALFRPLCGETRFSPFWTHPTRPGLQAAAHDWAFCRDLAAQAARPGLPADRRPILLPSVACRHYTSVEAWLDP